MALYPTFIGVKPGLPTPGVGDHVYVDYGDRINLEDPRYYGLISKKPQSGGILVTENVSSAKDSHDQNKIKDEDNLNNSGMLLEDNEGQSEEEPEQSLLFPDIINITKNYSQGDSRWGDDILGIGDHTIAEWGCLLTSITMCFNTLKKKDVTPRKSQ